MKKTSIMQSDFEHLVHLIRERVQLTPEQRELWEQGIKKIEEEIDKPTGADATITIPPYYKPVKPEDGIFGEKRVTRLRRFKNWLIEKLQEEED